MFQQTAKTAGAILVIAVGAVFFLGPLAEKNASAPAKQAALAQPQRQPAAKVQTQLPSASTVSGVRGVEYINADQNGHYSANIEVNGTMIRTLVDTGATTVAFGAADAERAGIRPARSEYKFKTQTANGEVAIARVVVRSMRLGSIELQNIEAAVLPEGALDGTLLGMSFLKQLQVQSENGRLILKQ